MHFVLLAGRYCIFYVIGHIVVFYLYVSFYLCMFRPMYICTGFNTCICPAFYAVILLINILLLLLKKTTDADNCSMYLQVPVVCVYVRSHLCEAYFHTCIVRT